MTERNDLYLRSRQEIIDHNSSGGCTIFLTFTYDEDHVPYYRYSLDKNGYVVFSRVRRQRNTDLVDCLMTFDKSHLTNYFKRLRFFFSSKFGLDECFRYISVPEYGTKRTERPHYHALFFLSADLCQSLLRTVPDNRNTVLVETLTNFFQSFWPYGLVSGSLDYGLFVDSDFASKYVTKYILKNDSLLLHSRFKQFFDWLCDRFNDPVSRIHVYDCLGDVVDLPRVNCTGSLAQPPLSGKKGIHKFTKPMSFFLYYVKKFEASFYIVKSQGFGLKLKDQVPTTSAEAFNDYRISVYDSKHAIMRHYKIPAYISNKILFNHRKDGSYYFSDTGLLLYEGTLVYKYENFIKYFKRFDWNVVNSMSVYDLYSRYGVVDIDRDRSFLLRNYRTIFAYALLFRGRFVKFEDTFKYSSLFYSFKIGDIDFRTLCRYVVPSLVDLSPFSDIRTDTLSQYLAETSDKYSDLNFRYFDHCLDFWTACVNFARTTVLDSFRKVSDFEKEKRDLDNKEKYKFMSFRKSVRSCYVPNSLNSGGFGESFYETSFVDDSKFLSSKFSDVAELNRASLPMMSLDTIVKSGNVIQGNQSFAPSDPASIELTVHSELSQFLSNIDISAHED